MNNSIEENVDRVLIPWQQFQFAAPLVPNSVSSECIDLLDFKRKPKRRIIEEICQNDASSAKVPCKQMVRPWSYSDFLDRLRTFKASTWFAKPEYLSALRCARFGWRNENVDCLVCTVCGVEYKIEDDDNLTEQKAVDDLKNRHLQSCGWRYYDSPLSFMRIQQFTHEDIIRTFIERTSTFFFLNKELLQGFEKIVVVPSIIQEKFPQFCDAKVYSAVHDVNRSRSNITDNVWNGILNLIWSNISLEARLSLTSIMKNCPELVKACSLMGIFGWKVSKIRDRGVIVFCVVCDRQLGVDKLFHHSKFDPLYSHRSHCCYQTVCKPLAIEINLLNRPQYEFKIGWELVLEAVLEVIGHRIHPFFFDDTCKKNDNINYIEQLEGTYRRVQQSLSRLQSS